MRRTKSMASFDTSTITAPSAGSSVAGRALDIDFDDSFLASLLQQGDDDGISIGSWSALLSILHDENTTTEMVVHNQFFPLGTRVESFFPNPKNTNVLQMYHGVITAFDAEYGWYLVHFEDNDVGEFTHDEIVGMLRDI